jgi:hypothetical protein
MQVPLARLVGFYSLACLLTWSCWLPILAEKHKLLDLHGHIELLATLGQFGPFAAAIAWVWIDRGVVGIRDLLRRMVQTRVSLACLAVALLLPPVLFATAIYINVWLGRQIAPAIESPASVEAMLHFLVTLVLGGPLGEEPGWRGYALPRLRQRFGVVTGSFILAAAWACWHWPLWWIADVPTSFPYYVLGMIPLTFLFTWLDEWGKHSILVAMLFHASLNNSLVRLPVFPAILVTYALFWVIAIGIAVMRGREWLRVPNT